MKTILIACALLLSVTLIAQERINLSTPQVKTNTGYELNWIRQDFDNLDTPVDEGTIRIELRGTNGELVLCTYNSTTAPTGTTLNNALNRVNFSTAYAGNATSGSFRQRVYHRLVVMQESKEVCSTPIIGTLTGVPQ